MITNSQPPLPELAFLKRLGLTHRVGLVFVAVGVLVILASGILGGIFYELVLSLLELLDAPEDRDFLSPDKPGAGPPILRFLGSLIIGCGVLIVSLRLAIGLLGLTARPEPTDKLGPVDKAGLGIAVFGIFMIAAAAIPEVLLFEILPREPRSLDPIPAFSIVASIGSLCLWSGLLVVALGGPRRREVLLGWTRKLGWGKLGHEWVNKFAIALLVLAIAVSMVGLEDGAPFIFGAGVAVFLLGIAVNYFAGSNP